MIEYRVAKDTAKCRGCGMENVLVRKMIVILQPRQKGPDIFICDDCIIKMNQAIRK